MPALAAGWASASFLKMWAAPSASRKASSNFSFQKSIFACQNNARPFVTLLLHRAEMATASLATPRAFGARAVEVLSLARASRAWTSNSKTSNSFSGLLALLWSACASLQSFSASAAFPPLRCNMASSCRASASILVSPSSRNTSSRSSAASKDSCVVCLADCMRAISANALLSPWVSPASWKSSCAWHAASNAPERSFRPNWAEAMAMHAFASSRLLPVFSWSALSAMHAFRASRKASDCTQTLLIARRAEISSSRFSASRAISSALRRASSAFSLLCPSRCTRAASCINLISPALSPISLRIFCSSFIVIIAFS
mmetsp:Transcript_88133/g.285236  ORF Transcript_88133/g.285236 Transcript_88133/m.285236 type:complete len:316 (-) Transcript_88133:507-1454(-)